MFLLLYDFDLTVGWYPFCTLVEPDSDAIVCDNSMRFLEKTIIRMMTKIIKSVIASGLPIAEGKS